MGLSFTIAAGPRQRSHSHVRVPRDSWPHFTVSNSRLPPTWRARSPYLYPQEQGGPVVPPVTRFPIRRLLRLAGLQSQRYFTTGGLSPISSSWRQAPWDLRPEIFFFKLSPCGNSPYVKSSLTRRWVCFLWIWWPFVKRTHRTYSTLLKILPFALYTTSESLKAESHPQIFC
jgi:hypothetical protein